MPQWSPGDLSDRLTKDFGQGVNSDLEHIENSHIKPIKGCCGRCTAVGVKLSPPGCSTYLPPTASIRRTITATAKLKVPVLSQPLKSGGTWENLGLRLQAPPTWSNGSMYSAGCLMVVIRAARWIIERRLFYHNAHSHITEPLARVRNVR